VSVAIRQQGSQFRQGAASSLDTLIDFAGSIGRGGFLSIFDVASGLAQTSAGTGSVATADPVGCWLAQYQVGGTFKFHQPTNSARPTYSTTQYSAPTVYGNGSSHTLLVDSPAVLSRPLTVLCLWENNNGLGMPWSHNGQGWGVRHQSANSPPTFLEFGTSAHGQGSTGDLDLVSAYSLRYRQSATAGTGLTAAAFNSSEPVRATRYGTAFHLFSGGSSLFSPAGIRRIAFVDRMTGDQACQALRYFVR
jgi:hypothetical protein